MRSIKNKKKKKKKLQIGHPGAHPPPHILSTAAPQGFTNLGGSPSPETA
jgi:hypothetical protein